MPSWLKKLVIWFCITFMFLMIFTAVQGCMMTKAVVDTMSEIESGEFDYSDY